MLRPFNTAPHLVVTPTIKVFLLLLHNGNSLLLWTVMPTSDSHDIWEWPLWKGHLTPKGVVTHKLRTSDFGAWKLEDQGFLGHPCIPSEFEASVGYMKLSQLERMTENLDLEYFLWLLFVFLTQFVTFESKVLSKLSSKTWCTYYFKIIHFYNELIKNLLLIFIIICYVLLRVCAPECKCSRRPVALKPCELQL